ncbi:unnamed protein product [Larinioides sclopetarius]|uniref:Uncharacterized protein n=1 Tax=Larinioides sclopetarius TaxID=280406 RepID=A0AAV2BSJ8_9ARAC
MCSDINYRKIAIYLLFSILCSDCVFSLRITSVIRQRDDGDKVIYHGDENRPILDYHLTTTKQYQREDQANPTTTTYPVEYANNSYEEDLFTCMFFAVLFIILAVFIVMYHAFKDEPI